MSIFGDLETPKAEKPEPPAKQLVELSLKAHTTWDHDRQTPVIQGILDVPTNTVHLRAEAKTAFSDGTAGDGVKVTFFLNSNQLQDVPTDDFGLAVFQHPISAQYFTMNVLTDELITRVRGFAKESSVKVQVHRKELKLTMSHRWSKIMSTRFKSRSGSSWDFEHYAELSLGIKTETYPQGFFSVAGALVTIQRAVLHHSWQTIATSKLDTNGTCVVLLPDYYYSEHQKELDEFCNDNGSRCDDVFFKKAYIPKNLATSCDRNPYIHSDVISGVIKVLIEGWPDSSSFSVSSPAGRSHLIFHQ